MFTLRELYLKIRINSEIWRIVTIMKDCRISEEESSLHAESSTKLQVMHSFGKLCLWDN